MKCLALVALAGCTDVVQLDSRLAGLQSIEVTPADATVAIDDLGEPAQTVTYTATGHFAHGETRDITAFLTWTGDDPVTGGFAAPGAYTTSNAAGGHVAITADSGIGISGDAKLTVVVTATIVDGAFPPPGDPATLFPPGAQPIVGDPMHSPALAYPADGTVFPQGVARTLVQYAPGAQNDAFRLHFDSDVLHLTVITGADRWLADGAMWNLVAGSGIAGPIALAVDGTSSTGSGAIYASAPAQLVFSRDLPAGLIYFGAAAQNAIARGALAATSAGKLWPTDASKACCPSVSRDGSSLAVQGGGEILATINLTSLAAQIPASAHVPMDWATFSPDASRVLVAKHGALALYDASGALLSRVDLGPNLFATQPDWSPDGSTIAVALTAMAPTAQDTTLVAASIARMRVSGDTLGAPEVLVAATGMDDNYAPRYSPDGRYLAFVRQTGAMATTAALWIVAADGGTPVQLAAAGAGTMPAWAPANGDHAWLAFASTRAYGSVLPPGTSQIWIAAIGSSPEGDPSAQAFWLPCQDVKSQNGTPAWGLELTVATP